MGCIASKQAVSAASPPFDCSDETDASAAAAASVSCRGGGSGAVVAQSAFPESSEDEEGLEEKCRREEKLKKVSVNGRSSLALRLGNVNKYVEAAEYVTAGWPSWLTAVAGEAIQGWVPLRADSYEKLEKIGQGTYSSVYRACEVDTGKMFALKKVRFDKYQPESVRFMAREIKILRRLDHPNIIKLEGIITSQYSSSIYLVFDYMEHDLTGLLSSPEIKFTEAQIKCYMKQLLSGIEHCHSQGIMHRDIKASNILVNNEGILKVADFGLANVFTPRNKQPLTSRVVTLWYRPPELILGSTNYGAYVDLWSVGCVFAELLSGKPILKGRTEVEQLHKIFKLCGSPPEEYWKKSKLPLATMFKPQCPYQSSLREQCTEFPPDAVDLIEDLLSIEPHKRGTASSALHSGYFLTKPYACEPSCLPKYFPNKEIDAKSREQAQRKKNVLKVRDPGRTRKPRRVDKALPEPSDSRLAPKELEASNKFAHQTNGNKGNGGAQSKEFHKASLDTLSEVSQLTDASQVDMAFSNSLQIPASSRFSWVCQNENSVVNKSYIQSRLRSQVSLDPSCLANANYSLDMEKQQNENDASAVQSNFRGQTLYPRQNQRIQLNRPVSFDAYDVYQSHNLSAGPYDKDGTAWRNNKLAGNSNGECIEFSGPILTRSQGMEQREKPHIGQVTKKSRLQRSAHNAMESTLVV